MLHTKCNYSVLRFSVIRVFPIFLFSYRNKRRTGNLSMAFQLSCFYNLKNNKNTQPHTHTHTHTHTHMPSQRRETVLLNHILMFTHTTAHLTHIHIHTHRHPYTPTCKHMHTRAHTHTLRGREREACIHVCIFLVSMLIHSEKQISSVQRYKHTQNYET